MIASAALAAPKCPSCGKPIRLTRVVPSALPKESGVETQTHLHAFHAGPARKLGHRMAIKRFDPV
jgi:hypothetical protein